MGKVVVAAGVLAALIVAVYLGAGFYIYDLVSTLDDNCDSRGITGTPENFATRAEFSDVVDPTPYFIDQPYETVFFSSRGQSDLMLSAWYIPANDNPNTPTVIIVHGLTSCKREGAVLFSASMLVDAGFNVLLPDLNDHGDSPIVDGRFSAGVTEHLDVLGAYDWLREVQGVEPNNIGVMGFSLGAGTASIAFGREPGIAALWSDSSFAALEKTVAYELRDQYGLPPFFAGSAINVANWFYGIDIRAYNPVAAYSEARNGRPVFITHGSADDRLSVDFAYDLAAAVQATEPDFEPWIFEGAGHVDGFYLYIDDYEERLIAFFEATLG